MKRNKKFRDTQKSETKSNSLYEPAICVPVPKTQLLEQEFSFFLYLVRQSSSEINERNQFRFCQREVRRNVPFLFFISILVYFLCAWLVYGTYCHFPEYRPFKPSMATPPLWQPSTYRQIYRVIPEHTFKYIYIHVLCHY